MGDGRPQTRRPRDRAEYEQAIKQSNLPWAGRFVALTIASSALDPDESSPVTLRNLANWTELAGSSVAKYLTVLRRGGWLSAGAGSYELRVPVDCPEVSD